MPETLCPNWERSDEEFYGSGSEAGFWWGGGCVQSLHSFSLALRALLMSQVNCSVVSGSVTLWTVARQAPQSVEFSRQEYWSGEAFIKLWPSLESRMWHLPFVGGFSFPGVSDGKIICLQFWRPGFSSWVGKIPWGRKWQPTPVFLPGDSHGRRNLIGYSPWGCKESETTERLCFSFTFSFIKSTTILFRTSPSLEVEQELPQGCTRFLAALPWSWPPLPSLTSCCVKVFHGATLGPARLMGDGEIPLAVRLQQAAEVVHWAGCKEGGREVFAPAPCVGRDLITAADGNGYGGFGLVEQILTTIK